MNRLSAIIMIVAVVAAAPLPSTAGAPYSAPATEPFARISYAVGFSPLTTQRSVRNQAMGGAGVADPSVAANALYNPANLLGEDGVSAFYGSYKLYDLVDVYDTGVAATKTWAGSGVRGAIAVRQVFHRFEQEFVLRTVFTPEGTTSLFKSSDHGTGVVVAAGVPLGDASVAIGVGVDYAVVDNTFDKLSAWAYDVGALVRMPFEGARGDRLETRIGLSLLNAGNGFESGVVRSDSPQQVRGGFGACYTSGRTVSAPFSSRDASVVTLTLDADVVPDDPVIDSPVALVGFEMGLVETLFFRAGTGGLVGEQGDGVSYGAGLAIDYGLLCARADFAIYPSRSTLEDQETVFGFALEYRP